MSLLERARASLATSGQALRAATANPDLRRLQLAFLGSALGQWAASVAVTVYAFQEAGAGGVGLQIALRMIPGALAALLAGALADRYPRRALMIGSDLVRLALTVGLIVLVAAGAPYVLVLAVSALVGIAGTAFEPAKSALLPDLAREPEELTAANVVSSTIDSISLLAGPAIAGLLLAFTGVPVVLGVTALGYAWSAGLVAGIRAGDATPGGGERAGALLADAWQGLVTVARTPPVRLILTLVTAQTFVSGVLTVMLAAIALDLLDAGEGAYGAFQTAAGVGGVLGALGAAALVGLRRLAPPLALGLLLWGLPLVALGLAPSFALALVMLVLLGFGNTILDVSALTLLQRIADDDVRGRVFGVLESVILASVAAGGIAAAAFVVAFGIQATLVAGGLVLPVLVVLTWRPLSALDARTGPSVDLDLLRAVPIFAPLGAVALEGLAERLTARRAPAGRTVIRQGEPGDEFFVIAQGRAEVRVDGRPVREQGPGEAFGEIALLRDAPRSATVVAATDLDLRVLERDAFLGAVAGHAESAAAAEALAGARLAWAQPAAMPRM